MTEQGYLLFLRNSGFIILLQSIQGVEVQLIMFMHELLWNPMSLTFPSSVVANQAFTHSKPLILSASPLYSIL